MMLDDTHIRLIDDWQRGFPLVPEPFAVIGEKYGLGEDDVIALLQRLKRAGILSRVGATLRPNTAGASTLAAMSVPGERLDHVAALINDEPGINHNYERDHDYNLWFVATGADGRAVGACLDRISQSTGLDVLDLPLERSYFIDLGFSITDGARQRLAEPSRHEAHPSPLGCVDRTILENLQDGLALTSRPFAALAEASGVCEEACLGRLEGLVARGIVTRFGLIVRHRELGFTENAMVVWDVPDGEVDHIGALFARQPYVTLCYRRPRRLPRWPYNLFCMIHGRERGAVLDQIDALRALAGESVQANDILFSKRRFKQRGAQLTAA